MSALLRYLQANPSPTVVAKDRFPSETQDILHCLPLLSLHLAESSHQPTRRTLCSALALLPWTLITACGGTDEEPRRDIPFESLTSHNGFAIDLEGIFLVNYQDELRRILDDVKLAYPGLEGVRDIDFGKHSLLVLVYHPIVCESVEITRVFGNSSHLDVDATYYPRPQGAGCIASSTSPLSVISIPRTTARLTLHLTIGSVN